MRKGYTFVELMTIGVVMAILSVGAVVTMSRFSKLQNLESTKDEVSANLRLARSDALGQKLPTGMTRADYVRVEVVGNKRVKSSAVELGGANIQYFDKVVAVEEATVTVEENINFLMQEGKLVNDLGEPVDSNKVVNVIIGLAGLGETRVVQVDAMGRVSEN